MNLEVKQIMVDLLDSLESTGKGFTDADSISRLLESICDKSVLRGMSHYLASSLKILLF